MAGGLWVHKVERNGGVDPLVRKAVIADADRLILKTRDGRSPHNKDTQQELANAARDCGIQTWIWGWFYATTDKGGDSYIWDQARKITADAKRLGASGIVCNLEAPWSCAIGHRWAAILRDQFGNKPTRRSELKLRCEELLTAIKIECPELPLAVSTFPIPSSHGLPFETMAEHADQIWPQVYFSGMGYNRKIRKSVGQWTKLGAKALHYSGPGFLGTAKQRTMATALRQELTPDAQVDWWVADRMDDPELEAAQEISHAGGCA